MYDSARRPYQVLAEGNIQPLIPPRVNAVVWSDKEGSDSVHPRKEALTQIDAMGLALRKTTNNG